MIIALLQHGALGKNLADLIFHHPATMAEGVVQTVPHRPVISQIHLATGAEGSFQCHRREGVRVPGYGIRLISCRSPKDRIRARENIPEPTPSDFAVMGPTLLDASSGLRFSTC